MKAVFFQEGRASLIERPRPEAGPGEVVLKVLAAGVCHTDVELLTGYYGFAGIPGHEFVGRVVESPSDPSLVGRRAVAEINIGCGHCPWCRNGVPKHCPDRQAVGIKGVDGVFAEYVKVPQQNILTVPDNLDDQEAVIVEPLAAALEIGQQVHLTADLKTVVLGAGKLGLLIALALRTSCPDLLLIGRHDRGLDIAAAQGVRTLKTSSRQKAPFGLEPFDLVVEATGRPQGLDQALKLVRPQGTIAAKTTTRDPAPMDLARLVVNEVRLVGSRCGNFRLALSYLEHRLLDVRPLIEAEYPLADFGRALERARQPGVLKVILRP